MTKKSPFFILVDLWPQLWKSVKVNWVGRGSSKQSFKQILSLTVWFWRNQTSSIVFKFIEGEGAKKKVGGGELHVNLLFYIEKKSLPSPLPPPNYIVYHRESETSSVLTNWHSHLHQRKLCTVWNCYWLCRRYKREILAPWKIPFPIFFILYESVHIS